MSLIAYDVWCSFFNHSHRQQNEGEGERTALKRGSNEGCVENTISEMSERHSEAGMQFWDVLGSVVVAGLLTLTPLI